MTKAKKKPIKFHINKTFLALSLLVVMVAGFLWLHLSSIKYVIQSQNYPDARLLFEDTASIGGNVGQTNLFYWVSDDIVDVRDYFEELSLRFFVPQDNYGEWLITRFIRSNRTLSINDTIPYITHQTLCPQPGVERCVTLSLVDVSQPDFWRIAVMSPSSFRYSEQPFNLPSHNGTLIIYSYAHADF